MKNIAIFTTSRAEFGILSALLDKIELENSINYLLFVGGTHLLKEHGNTIDDIKGKYPIAATFDFFEADSSEQSLAKSMGVEMLKLASIFTDYKFDSVLVLGDRFELLPIVNSSIIFRKPLIHLHGGETTQGAIDDQIRHMTTKASHTHFVCCEEYKKNVLMMGEERWRVHNVGALTTDNMLAVNKIKKVELFRQLGLKVDVKTVLMTYHPTTLENDVLLEEQIGNIFKSLEPFDFQIVITAPNIDAGRDDIMKIINQNKNKNTHYFDSLGLKRYFSLIPHCEFVLGNSSSGIVEIPYFKIPTINIGSRQKGRIMHQSIINTDYSIGSIRKGIAQALDISYRESLKKMEYKFGDGNTAIKIVEILKNIEINDSLMSKKLSFLGEE